MNPIITGSTVIYKGKWLSYVNKDFTYNSKPGIWETIERPLGTEGVRIIPYVKSKHSNPQILVIANYRYPLQSKVIEFPAGLRNPGESYEECGIRELKEECGYTGKLVCLTNDSYSDPWKSNDHGKYAIIDIDIDDDINQHVKTNLDFEECIECFILSAENFLADVVSLSIKYNMKIDAGVMMIGQALELKKKLLKK